MDNGRWVLRWILASCDEQPVHRVLGIGNTIAMIQDVVDIYLVGGIAPLARFPMYWAEEVCRKPNWILRVRRPMERQRVVDYPQLPCGIQCLANCKSMSCVAGYDDELTPHVQMW